jgi:hypothetical protein
MRDTSPCATEKQKQVPRCARDDMFAVGCSSCEGELVDALDMRKRSPSSLRSVGLTTKIKK